MATYASIAGVDDMAIDAVAGVEAPSGGSGEDQHPGALLADLVSTADSTRAPITSTGHATPFADGTYVEVDPSLSADAAGIAIFLTATTAASTADSSTFVEIGTGAGGAEAHWATVPIGFMVLQQYVVVPGFIAAGTRVAVRTRSAITLQAVTAVYSFLPATKSVDPGAPVTMGHSTATARGVALTAPGSLNAKSAWTEIEDSTSATFTQIGVYPQAASDGNLSATGVLLDIGIGANGVETVLIPDLYLAFQSSEQIHAKQPMVFGVSVPAGSRLSGRWARANAGNSLDVVLIGA